MKKLLILLTVLSFVSCNKVRSWNCAVETTTTGYVSVPSLNGVREYDVHFTGTKKDAEQFEEDGTYVQDLFAMPAEDSEAQISFVTICEKK